MWPFCGPKVGITQVLGPLMGHMGTNSVIMGSKMVKPFVGQYMMIEKQQFGCFYVQKGPIFTSLGPKTAIWPSKRALWNLKRPILGSKPFNPKGSHFVEH